MQRCYKQSEGESSEKIEERTTVEAELVAWFLCVLLKRLYLHYLYARASVRRGWKLNLSISIGESNRPSSQLAPQDPNL